MFKIERISNSCAGRLIVSSNKKCVAISSEKKVRLLSYPAVEQIGVVWVRHAESLTFCEDDHSLLIVSTTGDIYLWTQDHLHSLGKWPEEMWQEGVIYYCGHNRFALAHENGICLFDSSSNTFRDIYHSKKCFAKISGIHDEKLHFITGNYPPIWRTHGIHMLDLQTEAEQECTTNDRFDSRATTRPIYLDDGNTAFISRKKNWRPFRRQDAFFLIDKVGHLVAETPVPQHLRLTPVDAVAASPRYLAMTEQCNSNAVLVFDRTDYSKIEMIYMDPLEPKLTANPPTSLAFISDEELLIGTWNRLYRCKITES